MQTNLAYSGAEVQPPEPPIPSVAHTNSALAASVLVLVLPLGLALGLSLRRRYINHRQKTVLMRQIELLERIWRISPNHRKK